MAGCQQSITKGTMKKIILFALIFFLLGYEKNYQYGAETFFSTVNYAIAGGAEYPFTSNNNKFYTENFKVFQEAICLNKA